jgi:hypothetical protein
MQSLPIWLETEDSVKRFFSLLGFDVKSVSIQGRQIDIVASKLDKIIGDHDLYVIEVTTEKVGVDKGSKDSQKLLLARAEHKVTAQPVSKMGVPARVSAMAA